MALEACKGCGEPVWPENNPCDPCKEKTPAKPKKPSKKKTA